MGEDLEKLHLADRTEAILRSDRQAFRQVQRQRKEPVLLTLVPDNGAVIDLMDAYIPDIADAAGLKYVRLIGSDLHNLPRACLERTFLLLADLTGRDENVITLVYEALGMGRRVLLAAQSADEIPEGLESMPAVLYSLQHESFDELIQGTARLTTSTLDDGAFAAKR